MCGIFGVYSPSSVSLPDAMAAADQLKHRGPDDGGVWIDPTNKFAWRIAD